MQQQAFGHCGKEGQDPHAAQQFIVQFITRHLHADGTSRARVTTFTRRCAVPIGPALGAR